MKNSQLAQEEVISNSRSLIGSSYDLASGGVPPHAHMLELLVAGKDMDDYARRTFLSGYLSNLLAIPGLTLYSFEEDEADAAAYFGEELAKEVIDKIREARQITSMVEGAIIRQFCYTDRPVNLAPITEQEFGEMLEHCVEAGYITTAPKPFDEWSRQTPPSDVMDFFTSVFNNQGRWDEEAVNRLASAQKRWLEAPFYDKGIELHLVKLDVMNQLLRFATGKAKDLGFADVDEFNPSTYFNTPHNDTSISEWEESFQKHFGKSVPSAGGLLDLSERVLADAQQKYAPSE